MFVRRHFLTFDLRSITDKTHRGIVQDALNQLDARMYRIRRATGRRVPVAVKDLANYMQDSPATGEHGAHDHSHGYHLLSDPDKRYAALGLYWLPTRAFPAGRIELHAPIMRDKALAQEVFIAEAAHAYDFAVMTTAQRAEIFRIAHGGSDAPHQGHGWWEENGNHDYWSTMGETFMGIFMRAFAPSLPRPLEARQPWVHRVTDDMVAKVREVLK